MVSDKVWESREISMWVNNVESLYELARGSWSPNHFLQVLEDYGISEIEGITLTAENLRESWEDANDE